MLASHEARFIADLCLYWREYLCYDVGFSGCQGKQDCGQGRRLCKKKNHNERRIKIISCSY